MENASSTQLLETENLLKRLQIKENEQSIISELSHITASAILPEALSDFITKRITSLFGGKYYMIWLINEDGQALHPFLYSQDEELTSNLHTQSLIKTSFKLRDGIWDNLELTHAPTLIDLGELTKLKVVPAWIPLWYYQGIKEMLGMAFSIDHHLKGFFCIYGNRISALPSGNFDFLKAVTAQIAACIKLLQFNQTIAKQGEEIAHLRKKSVEHTHKIDDRTKGLTEIIGSGTEMKKVIRLISVVAPSDTTVLLTGETGTGKELIARAIHNTSLRKEQPLISVNCAALPANLIESELFGHEKGSFTDAIERRTGKFEQADGGTIFLDEIGELPLELQVRLLRVLQEKEVERIGGKRTFKVNVRVIAATNRDLQKEMETGRFRSDLYFRLNVFPIQLPPLHKRKEDIPELVSHFMERHANRTGKKLRIPVHVLRSLQAYSWPGNIRELENLIERSILNTEGDILTEVHLPINDIVQKAEKTQRFSIRTLAEMEKEYILEVVKYCNGKISGPHGAAVKLGIPSTTLISKMQKLGIRKEHFVDRRD